MMTAPPAPLSSTSIRVEEYSDSHLVHQYVIHDNHKNIPTFRTTSTYSFQHALTQLFLPVHYPQSVRSTYLPFQIYDSLQGISSYIRGILCTSSLLRAAGVGNASATPLSAALVWTLRDGFGMLTALAVSYYASQYFDSHVKEFRVLADCMNDVGLTIDMLTPYVAEHSCQWGLAVCMATSAMAKALCGLAAGATKSSITAYFALDHNIADLLAKESTQETFVSLLGMILGAAVAHYCTNTILLAVMFVLLTVFHIWANVKAVSLLKLTTLNHERARLAVFQAILLHLEQQQKQPQETSSGILEHDILAPEQTHESLLRSWWALWFPPFRHVTWSTLWRKCSLDHQNTKLLETALQDHHPKYLVMELDSVIYVCLMVGATPRDEMYAWIEAYTRLHDRSVPRHILDAVWSILAKKGWDTSRVCLGWGSQRSRVQLDSLKEE